MIVKKRMERRNVLDSFSIGLKSDRKYEMCDRSASDNFLRADISRRHGERTSGKIAGDTVEGGDGVDPRGDRPGSAR